MIRASALVLASVLLLACQGDDTNDGADAADQTSAPQGTDDSTETLTNDGDPVCLASGGAYGKCSESLCQCVQGGDIYQYCTKPCTETSECGDPSEFPGATPDCAPVNPGDPNMLCVLRCQTTADCPCGLECEPTYLVCSEPQP